MDTDYGINQVEETQFGFKAPKRVIKTPAIARTVYNSLREGHIRRIALYAEIKGLLDGSPPYNPQKLAQAGLNIANFNDMSARAVFERACLAYWNLLHNAEVSTRFVINLRNPDGTRPPELDDYAKVLARNWDFAVRTKWPSYTTNLASMQAQLVMLGVSPVLFPDERSPKWRMIELNRFFVPDQAQSDLDMLPRVIVATDFTVQYLWELYESKDETPWNKTELGKLLVHVAGSFTQQPISDAMDLQKKMLSGDSSLTRMYTDTVRLISLFQREYSGKISHSIFHPTYSNDNEFLFDEEEQYADLSQALIIYTMNPGEFTIHGNRGVGHKIFSLAQAKIQVGCSMVDQTKWASTPIIKSSSLSTKDFQQIKVYPGVATDIGTAELQQNNLGANVQNSVSVAQYLTGQINFNISYSGSDPASPDPDQGSISPTQARLASFREFSVLKNFIMHYQMIHDRLVQNMTSVMLRSKAGWPDHEIAKTWKERCIAEGVPEVIFDVGRDSSQGRMPRHIEVYATRVAGAGSQVAELIGLQELQAIVGSFGPREERAYKKRFISATVGHESVSEFTQDDNNPDETAGGASLAGVENAIMQAGKSPIFSKDNEHRSHFATHMALGENTVRMLQQQQMDVIEADSIFGVLVPHMGEHLQALSQNVFAQSFFAQAQPQFTQLERYATLNRKNAAKVAQTRIKQQAAQEEATRQAMTDEELKTMQILNDEKRKDFKLGAQTQRQERAGEAKEEALRRKTDVEVATKRQKTDAEVAATRAKSGLDNLKNTAVEDANENPREFLDQLNGNTIAPYDIETTK